jgi:large subunit ribosomal protein L7/L12
MANATMSKDEILDAIGNMSVLELSELVEAFKTKFNVTISAAPVGAAPAGGGAGAGAAPAAEEQTEFSLTLKEAGAKKIQVIKVVRELTGLGLKEAKDLVDAASAASPSVVKSGVTKDEAAAMKAKLEDQGATVEVK